MAQQGHERPVPSEAAREEIKANEPLRALHSTALGVALGFVLAALARRARG